MTNDFRHTRLYVSSAMISLPDQEEHVVEHEVAECRHYILLTLRNPLSILNLTNSVEEDEAANV